MSEVKRTVFAGKAFSLAELFKIALGTTKVHGDVDYTPELSSPEGESTGGGTQAGQHLSLTPEGGGTALVVATANVVEKKVELRTFANVSEMHRRRFKGAAFPIDQAAYDQFLTRAQEFFDGREFKVTRADAPA